MSLLSSLVMVTQFQLAVECFLGNFEGSGEEYLFSDTSLFLVKRKAAIPQQLVQPSRAPA